jgi:hypothetical protein
MGVNPIEHFPANLFQGLDVLYNISAWQMKLLDLPPTLLRNLPSLLEMYVSPISSVYCNLSCLDFAYGTYPTTSQCIPVTSA